MEMSSRDDKRQRRNDLRHIQQFARNHQPPDAKRFTSHTAWRG
jgi:hypothetical protein